MICLLEKNQWKRHRGQESLVGLYRDSFVNHLFHRILWSGLKFMVMNILLKPREAH